jgi:hypothetical protein
MATTSSLTKFSVPLAGNDIPGQGLLMPKLKFRFRATFDNFGVSNPKTELTKQIVSFARPTVEMAPVELPVYNSRIYIAGRPTWSVSQVVLRDDSSGQVAKLVGEQLQKQFDFMEQASSSSGIDYKFVTTLQMLDGGNGNVAPVVLEEWNLIGCFLSSVAYGDADYSSNDPMTITMQIRYDNAFQTPQGQQTSGVGFGASVTQTRSTATG